MNNQTVLLGVIGLLVLGVIGLFIDRSNQITTLTEQAESVAADAQSAAENFEATIEAQTGELDSQTEAITAGEEALTELQTQVAVSSTEFEDQISELESANDVLESNNTDFVTQVAELSEVSELEANNAQTQAAVAATAQADALAQADLASTQAAIGATVAADAIIQAELAATSEAEAIALLSDVEGFVSQNATLEASNIALATQVAELQPTSTPTPEPTVVAEVSELEILWEADITGAGVIDIAPDGESVAVLRLDDVIVYLSTEDGTSQSELTDLPEGMQDFAFSNNGRSLAIVANFSQLFVLDSATGVIALEEAIRNPIRAYAFAGDDGAIAVQTGLETEIFTLEEGPRITRIGGVDLDWSADGANIASTDGSIIEILAMDGYQIDTTTAIETDISGILMIEFSPDSSMIAGVTAEGTVMVMDVASGEVVWSDETGSDMVDDVAWAGDSANLAVVAGGEVFVYSADGNSTTTASIADVVSVDWSDDGSLLVFASGETVWAISADTLTN